MPRHRPVIFSDKLLLPAYDEKTMHTQIFNTATNLTTLELYSEIKDKAIQGDILFKDQNTLQIFLRAAGDYNHVLSSTSYDLGRSWRNLKQTSLFLLTLLFKIGVSRSQCTSIASGFPSAPNSF